MKKRAKKAGRNHSKPKRKFLAKNGSRFSEWDFIFEGRSLFRSYKSAPTAKELRALPHVVLWGDQILGYVNSESTAETLLSGLWSRRLAQKEAGIELARFRKTLKSSL